jgi:hypothetical protein
MKITGIQDHVPLACRSLTAEVTATAAHNEHTGLTPTTDDRDVQTSDLGLSLN